MSKNKNIKYEDDVTIVLSDDGIKNIDLVDENQLHYKYSEFSSRSNEDSWAKRIIYKQNEGGVAVVIPSAEALEIMTVEQIAKKDVPTGLKYKIVDISEISSDRTFRNAWEIDEAELTDGVGD